MTSIYHCSPFCPFRRNVHHLLTRVHVSDRYPLAHPEVYDHLRVQPPRGVLLHGPPGCGKTMLAHAIANETGVRFLSISAPEVVSGMSGESEAKIRTLFQDAERMAPALIFIDEIDAITPKRETAQVSCFLLASFWVLSFASHMQFSGCF